MGWGEQRCNRVEVQGRGRVTLTKRGWIWRCLEWWRCSEGAVDGGVAGVV